MSHPTHALPRRAGQTLLRRLNAGDLAAFHAYRSDPVVAQYQGWSTMTAPQALAFINEMAVAELFVPGTWAQLAIARAEDGALVGDLGLLVAASGEVAEVGFTVSPTAQGQGHGTAAVALALRFVFECTAVARVIGVTDSRNQRSVRLLERVGMTRIESRDVMFKGQPCTEWVYARQR